jgi:hypothetical protein
LRLHLLEGVLGAVADAEAHLDDPLLAQGEGLEEGVGLLLEVQVDDVLGGGDGRAVLDEVAEMRVLLLPDRGLERDGPLGDLQDFAHLGDRDVHALRDPLRGGFAAQLLDERA